MVAGTKQHQPKPSGLGDALLRPFFFRGSQVRGAQKKAGGDETRERAYAMRLILNAWPRVAADVCHGDHATQRLIACITDRMPAILPREWQTWLGETDASLDDVKALLRTYCDGGN